MKGITGDRKEKKRKERRGCKEKLKEDKREGEGERERETKEWNLYKVIKKIEYILQLSSN